MALTIKVLANNVLSTVLTNNITAPLYMPATATPAKVAIVKAWRFTNTGTTPVKINAYFQKNVANTGGVFLTSAARRILPKDLVLAPGYSAVDDVDLTLGSGDGLFAVSDTATAVDYVVSGVERDA